jgi:predicted lactoylglutathione lyase
MIGYVTLGTNDIARAAQFYDELLGELGATRLMDTEAFIVWANPAGLPGLSITKPFDENAATNGNGVMVALAMESKEDVDRLHRKALELGAQDEGAPGPRGDTFYAGYFRDLDGNKLNAYFMG